VLSSRQETHQAIEAEKLSYVLAQCMAPLMLLFIFIWSASVLEVLREARKDPFDITESVPNPIPCL